MIESFLPRQSLPPRPIAGDGATSGGETNAKPCSTRREFLSAAAAAAGTLALRRLDEAKALGASYQPATEPLRLGETAARKGVLYGTSVSSDRLPKRPADWSTAPYSQLIKRQAKIIVNHYTHFDRTQPIQGRFDFREADRVADYARGNGLPMRGTTLCWYEHFPKWMADMDRASAIKAMEEHIEKVTGYYAGATHSWDVVNEALNPYDRGPNGLRISGFTRSIGWDWMDFAFQAARRGDPKALLTYNDYRIEVTGYGDSDARRKGLLYLLDDFQRRKIPIDAIGVQSHIEHKFWKHFKPEPFAKFLDEIAARGVNIYLSELDVNDKGTPTDPAERDEIIAELYRNYLAVALANKAVVMVITWGLHDPEAWQNSPWVRNPEFVRDDGSPQRGLPFDSEGRPKPAAYAIAKAFEEAPGR